MFVQSPLTWNNPSPIGISTALCGGQITQLQIWGDSMAAGDGGSTANTRWCQTLPAAMSRQVFKGGIGGETSTQVAARFLANIVNRNGVALFWMGHNDADATTVVTKIQQCLAWMPIASPRYKVFSPLITAASAPASGGYVKITDMRTNLQNAFGSHYLDLTAALAAAGDGSANDNSDIANGWTPRSLRASGDEIHLGDNGQAVVKTEAQAAIVAASY